MYGAWYEEVAELAVRANAWCNFALWCGWIGFGLSVVALVILLAKMRNENRTD